MLFPTRPAKLRNRSSTGSPRSPRPMRSTRASRSSGVHVRLGEIETASRSEAEEIGLRLFVGQRSATAASSTSPRTPFDDGRAGLAMANRSTSKTLRRARADRDAHRGDLPDLDADDPREPDASELRERVEAEKSAMPWRASPTRRAPGERFGDDNGARDLGRILGAYQVGSRLLGGGCRRGRPDVERSRLA